MDEAFTTAPVDENFETLFEPLSGATCCVKCQGVVN